MFRLTSSQYEIWNSQTLYPKSPLYNENIAVHIHGPLDLKRFSTCWKRVVDENEVLKTRINLVESVPYQTFDAPTPELLHKDFSCKDNPDSEAKRYMQALSNLIVDLQFGTVTTCLIKLKTDRWIWFIQQHHIAVDAWSMSLIWNRLAELYGSSGTGDVADSGYDYKQVLEKYNDNRVNNDQAAEVQHWLERRNTRPLKLYGRSVLSNDTSSTRIDIPLSIELLRRIDALLDTSHFKTFNRQLGIYQILLAVVIAWLSRISGEKSIDIIMPSACRNTTFEKRCAGYFIEVLPFQINTEGNESFKTLYKKIQVETMQFIRNAKFGMSQYNNNESRPNIFFNFINGVFNGLDGFDTNVEWIHTDHIDAMQAIRIHITDWQSNDSVNIAIDFNNGWFNTDSITRAVSHFEAMLEGLTHDPDEPIVNNNLICRDDVWHLKDSNTPEPTDESFRHLANAVLDVCKTHSNKVALVQGKREITYNQLSSTSFTFSNLLLRKKIQPGERIIVLLDREWHLVPVLVGSLLAGAVYIPVDLSNPLNRVRKIISDAKPTIIVGSHKNCLFNDLSNIGFACTFIDIESIYSDSKSQGFESNLIEVQASQKIGLIEPGDPACIIYTSGSTGEPKGVELSHRSLWHFCHWANSTFGSGDPLVFPLVTSIGFDITAIPLYTTLLSGGTLHLYPASDQSDALAVVNMIKNKSLNSLCLTPSQLSIVQDNDLASSNVNLVLLLGEQLKVAIAKRIINVMDHSVSVFNMYGPAECTIACFIEQFDSQQHTETSVPIGQPLASMEGLVLDDHGNPQLQGLPGELYLAGPLVANGYWNDSDKTKQVFIDLPKYQKPRAYKTGDMVRVNEQGRIEYLGRNDYQIKRNGIRIERGEIESVALQHNKIRAAAVKVLRFDSLNNNSCDSETENDDLVLYYVANMKLSNEEVYSHLIQYLTKSVLPNKIVYLPEFPLNANGKTDYSCLPNPTTDDSKSESLIRPPITETEKKWFDLWSRYLTGSTLSTTDNFFNVGGNSILAIKLITEMNAFGYGYEPGDIFTHRTIHALSKLDRSSDYDSKTVLVASKPFDNVSASDLLTIQEQFK